MNLQKVKDTPSPYRERVGVRVKVEEGQINDVPP